MYSNHEIEGKIALFSLYIEFGKELITLNEEAVVLYRNKTDRNGEYPDRSQKIIFKPGNYSLQDIQTLIKKHVPDFTLGINKENNFQMFIGMLSQIVLSKNLLSAIGMQQSLSGKWLSLGPYFGIKRNPQKLSLVCDEIDAATHFIDGRESKCIFISPLTANVLTYNPHYLIYYDVKYPTRYLNFKLLDEHGFDIPVKHIVIQLINKEHGNV